MIHVKATVMVVMHVKAIVMVVMHVKAIVMVEPAAVFPDSCLDMHHCSFP